MALSGHDFLPGSKERTMSISVNAATRVSPVAIDTSASATSADATPRGASGDAEVEIDPATQMPVPPRFPWLSRLASQLEPVARQKPPFASAPLLGDHLDRAA
jgi:hypothetical protein